MDIDNFCYIYTNTRYEASGFNYGTVERIESFEKVVESIFRFELGYGGQVMNITPTSIEIRTRVMSKVDHVTIEATEEEMEPVLYLLSIWMKSKGKVAEDTVLDEIEKSCGGNPLLVTSLAGIIQGSLANEEFLKALTK